MSEVFLFFILIFFSIEFASALCGQTLVPRNSYEALVCLIDALCTAERDRYRMCSLAIECVLLL